MQSPPSCDRSGSLAFVALLGVRKKGARSPLSVRASEGLPFQRLQKRFSQPVIPGRRPGVDAPLPQPHLDGHILGGAHRGLGNGPLQDGVAGLKSEGRRFESVRRLQYPSQEPWELCTALWTALVHVSKVICTSWPTIESATMMATEIKPPIRAYSTAVTPSSVSKRNFNLLESHTTIYLHWVKHGVPRNGGPSRRSEQETALESGRPGHLTAKFA